MGVLSAASNNNVILELERSFRSLPLAVLYFRVAALPTTLESAITQENDDY
jgi:hypothetical protein